MAAETIAKALGGRKAGGGWMARCPTHQDREPSLSIRDAGDGKVLIRCHPSSGIWPAMVALVTRGDDDTPLAIHCTLPATVAT
jgi:putative DNA primase/helicase